VDEAAEITDRILAELATGRYRHARLTTPNGDMVGHTGARDAPSSPSRPVDLSVGPLLPAIRGCAARCSSPPTTATPTRCSSADKKSKKLSPQGGHLKPKTSHTLTGAALRVCTWLRFALRTDLEIARLANVAATVLELVGYTAAQGLRAVSGCAGDPTASSSKATAGTRCIS